MANPIARLQLVPRPPTRAFVVERRVERSDSAAVAIELALTRAATRSGLDALVLVDDGGMLVANNRTDLDLSMLAAVTPIVARGRATPRIKRDGQPREMSIAPLDLAGERFYLAALGGSASHRQRELEGGCQAAQRILAA